MTKVTVLMAAYNAGEFISQAIRSVLLQTYKDFKFLIINDGSTDNTVEIIKSFTDPRIELLHNEVNIGLVDTLNKGYSLVETEYLVRQDADDISVFTRIEKLVQFMELNTDHVICSSWFQYFGVYEKVIRHPETYDDIRVKALAGTPLLHGAAIYRIHDYRELGLFYDKEYLHAEDYEMLTRACKVGKLHNIPEILYYYRTHPEQVSSRHLSFQLEQDQKIRYKYFLTEFQTQLDPDDERLYHDLIIPRIRCISNSDLGRVFGFAYSLMQSNRKVRAFDNHQFDEFLKERLISILYIRRDYHPKLILFFALQWRNGLVSLSFLRFVGFLTRCLVFYRV